MNQIQNLTATQIETKRYLTMFELKKDLPSSYLSPSMLAAIRGPDSEDVNASELKYELTGRIRALLFNYYPGVHTRHPMGEEGFRNAKTALEALSVNFRHDHFLSHLCTALVACKDENVWGTYGEDLLTLLKAR